MTAPLNGPVFILANFTAESLALRLREKGIDARTSPGFDTWRTELLNPSSSVWELPSGIIFLLLHGPALFSQGETALNDALEIIKEALAKHPDRTLVLSTLDLPSAPARSLTGASPARQAAQHWRAGLEKLQVPVLDLEELVSETGRENFYNARTWYFGALPFSAQGERRLSEEVLRVCGILRRGRKKCLVLDLDGVMWGGVAGEDGPEGVLLSDHGIGAVYHDVQAIAKGLARQGVLLAVSSKNNPEDAMLPFETNPHAVLRPEDFVIVRANWDPKPQNIREIARDLNIGMDSLVFIDDNPVEREAVRASCPGVEVPDFPTDTAALPAFMRGIADKYFTAPRLNAEDAVKSEMYRAEARREEDRMSHASLDEYLASLDMKLDLHALTEDEAARAAQLCAKTNQFNLTTRRHSEADIRAMMSSENHRLWIASLTDRFGDYGRIALVIASLSGRSADFDTFLMSCRAMGRGVEAAVLSRIEKELASLGAVTLTGHYFPTAKNEPVKNFWRDMGYTQQDGGAWTLKAPFQERKNFIN